MSWQLSSIPDMDSEWFKIVQTFTSFFVSWKFIKTYEWGNNLEMLQKAICLMGQLLISFSRNILENSTQILLETCELSNYSVTVQGMRQEYSRLHQKISVFFILGLETRPDRRVESAPHKLKWSVFKWSDFDLGVIWGFTPPIIERWWCPVTSGKWGQRPNPPISCLRSKTVSRILQHVWGGKTMDQWKSAIWSNS